MLAVAPLIGFIPVRDLAAARSFYEDKVGLIIVDQTPQAVVAEAGGGAMIRITLVPEFQAQPFTIVGWSVPEAERAVRRLRANGIAMTLFAGLAQDALGLWTAPSGDRVGWFQDPDGNVLSVTEFVNAVSAEVGSWSAPPPHPA